MQWWGAIVLAVGSIVIVTIMVVALSGVLSSITSEPTIGASQSIRRAVFTLLGCGLALSLFSFYLGRFTPLIDSSLAILGSGILLRYRKHFNIFAIVFSIQLSIRAYYDFEIVKYSILFLGLPMILALVTEKTEMRQSSGN